MFQGKIWEGIFCPPPQQRLWISLKHCLFGGVKLAKNADPDKYGYTGYDIGSDLPSESSLPDGSLIKISIVSGLDMTLSVHIDNKK